MDNRSIPGQLNSRKFHQGKKGKLDIEKGITELKREITIKLQADTLDYASDVSDLESI